MVLPDDLSNRARGIGLEKVRTEPPDDRSVARDDREQARLAAADDDVVGREALIASIEPAVGTEIGRGIEVQPVERRRAGGGARRPAASRSRSVPLTLRVRKVGPRADAPASPSRLNSAAISSTMSPLGVTLGVSSRLTPTFRYWNDVAGANVPAPPPV
jgi:hypothetical protein